MILSLVAPYFALTDAKNVVDVVGTTYSLLYSIDLPR